MILETALEATLEATPVVPVKKKKLSGSNLYSMALITAYIELEKIMKGGREFNNKLDGNDDEDNFDLSFMKKRIEDVLVASFDGLGYRTRERILMECVFLFRRWEKIYA